MPGSQLISRPELVTGSSALVDCTSGGEDEGCLVVQQSCGEMLGGRRAGAVLGLRGGCRRFSASGSALSSASASASGSLAVQGGDRAFRKARVGGFQQEGPRHENAWRSDWVLQSYLKRTLPRY